MGRFFANITFFVLAILVVLVVYDASMRYLFSAGSTALQELEWHLFDVVILLGVVHTFKENSHVRVDIFYEHYTQKTKLLVDMFALLFFVIPFSILLAVLGFDFAHLSFIQNEMSSDPGGLPYRWIVKSLIVVAFTLLTLESVLELVAKFKKWRAL